MIIESVLLWTVGSAGIGFVTTLIKEGLGFKDTALPEPITQRLKTENHYRSMFHRPISNDREELEKLRNEKRFRNMEQEIQILKNSLLEKIQAADNNVMDNNCSVAEVLVKLKTLEIEIEALRKRISII